MDWSPILISMRTASLSILVTFFLGIFAAWRVIRLKNEKLKLIWDGILTLPLVLPPTVAGFFLLYIFGVKRPVGKFFLDYFSVKIAFSWIATVLAAVVMSFPLMYRSARGAFEQVDENLPAAARTLGMSEWCIFRKVLFANALPGIVSGGVLAFARGLGEFGATAMIAGNIAGKTRLGRERGAVSVVDDQIGSPTYTYDLARLLVDMIQTERYGRYHATNEGICSWYEFACEIFKQAGMDQVKVTPVDSASYPAKAKRPSNSRMSKEKLTENGFERLPDWQDALSRYLKELEKQEA